MPAYALSASLYAILNHPGGFFPDLMARQSGLLSAASLPAEPHDRLGLLSDEGYGRFVEDRGLPHSPSRGGPVWMPMCLHNLPASVTTGLLTTPDHPVPHHVPPAPIIACHQVITNRME